MKKLGLIKNKSLAHSHPTSKYRHCDCEHVTSGSTSDCPSSLWTETAGIHHSGFAPLPPGPWCGWICPAHSHLGFSLAGLLVTALFQLLWVYHPHFGKFIFGKIDFLTHHIFLPYCHTPSLWNVCAVPFLLPHLSSEPGPLCPASYGWHGGAHRKW